VGQVTYKSAEGKPEVLKIPCEVYSRVVGYLRPVNDWNEAKQQEFADRVAFKLPGTPGR